MTIKYETKIVKDGKETIIYKGECETEGVELIAGFICSIVKKVIAEINSPVPCNIAAEKEMD